MNYTNLPDLVIIGILKNTLIELDLIDGIKNALPFLAINQKWRGLALPTMYRYVFIEENGFSNQRLESNVGLVMDGRYTKKLSISVYTGDTKLIDILESLLNQMNPSKALTAQSTAKLLEYENNISSEYFSEPLNKEVVDAISEFLQNFTTAFPNVTGLHISLAYGSMINGYFASRLIDIYKDQLTELNCDVNTPLELDHFPQKLVKLDYTYSNWGTPNIPIINSSTLKELHLTYCPDTWSWQQYCESQLFANLEYLSISTNPNSKLESTNEVNEIRVDLPKLKALYINNQTVYTTHQLKIGDISEHLDRVTIDGDIDMLKEISKLAVKSIGWLCVCLRNDNDQNTEEFYQATNWLFSNHTNISLTLNGGMYIDYRRTRWKNVKELTVNGTCANGIIDILTNLPELKKFTVDWLYYEGMDESSLEGLGNSKVEELVVNTVLSHSGGTVMELENQLGKIAKRLPNISRI